MRFLANENISTTVVTQLRRQGHEVLSAKESMRGDADHLLLARAQDENLILLTHDKDFGELAFRHGCPATSGIILVRLSGEDPDADNTRTIQVVTSREDWAGHFSVVDERRIRMRPLNPAPRNPR